MMSFGRIRRATALLSTYLELICTNSLRGRKWIPERKYVFFDLADPRVSVYYFSLILRFYKSGYNILIKNRLRFIGNCQRIDKHLASLETVKFGRAPARKEDFLYIYDLKVAPMIGKWRRTVLLNPDVFSSVKEPEHLILPFSLSPDKLLNADLSQFESLRSLNRQKRIVFSGNLDPEQYDHPILSKRFNLLSRKKIFDILSKELTEEEVLVVDNEQTLLRAQAPTSDNVLIWYRWSWTPSSSENLDLRIDNKDWFNFISKSDFWLATPGVRMPLCFNVIEAMAVGTIPILEYADAFDPELEDGKNCLCFKGSDGLISAVRRALSMGLEERENIKKGVIDYYEKHLALGKLVERVESYDSDDLTLYFHATQVSVDENLKNHK